MKYQRCTKINICITR